MYHYGQVVGIELFENDVVVKREGDAPDTQDQTRADIKEFSKASRRRLAFVASNTPVEFTTMYTLTYPGEFPSDGAKVRRDRKAFLDWLRRDQRTPEYLWFLEFQKRGAPHLHILADHPWPKKRCLVQGLRSRVSMTWYRIVGSHDPRHLAAGTRTEKIRKPRGGAFYAVKYAMKMHQKIVPEGYRNCGRFWGHSRGVKPQSQGFLRCTEDDIRGVLMGWEFEPPEDRPVWKVVYNARPIFDAFQEIGAELDKPGETDYTGA